MKRRLELTRYFAIAAFGVNALTMFAINALIFVSSSNGRDAEGALLVGFFLNTASIAGLLTVNTWLFGSRWHEVSTKPLLAAMTFGLVTAPLSFGLNEWSTSPAPLSALILDQMQTSVALALSLGTSINMILFSFVGLALYASAKRQKRVATLSRLGLILVACLVPFLGLWIFHSVPAIAQSISWRVTGSGPQLESLTPVGTLRGLPGAALYPAALSVDSDSTVFVATTEGRSIVVFPKGAVRGKIAARTHVNEFVMGPPGSTAIALDRGGNVYLLDPPLSAILKYARRHDGSLVLTSRINIRDVKNPWGLAVDADERILILDNNRIDVFGRRDVRSGTPDQVYNIPQSDKTANRTYFTGPVVDFSGNLYVAASDLHAGGGMSTKVYIFPTTATDAARWVRSIGGFLTGLGGPGDFVEGLAIDRQGNLYVLATSPPRILEFALGAQGNVSPVAIYSISGGSEFNACCFGVGPDGMLYLGNRGGNSILTYVIGR